jgi:soluble lytic murein transglycosylase-like protein
MIYRNYIGRFDRKPGKQPGKPKSKTAFNIALTFSFVALVFLMKTTMQNAEVQASGTETPTDTEGVFCFTLNGKQAGDLPTCESWLEDQINTAPIETRIRYRAQQAGLDAERLIAIAKCESGLNPLAEHHISTASGVFQFTRPTWADGIKWRGLDWTLPDRFDANKNIDMAVWFMARGEWERWECDKLIRK